ncbi:unnamed protein product [Schistocephalus solidus]|uniref:Ephexin-1 n=1 Tax=Schistocephalus solidus TaxID=70667 RepID=A0A183SDN7_SCHSO|nr:unnamed protein product [Schistocephalus solidus]
MTSWSAPKIPNGVQLIDVKTYGSDSPDSPASVGVNSYTCQKTNTGPGDESGNETRYATQRLAGGPVGRCQWADMPEVAKRGLARDLTPDQRSLQEARFEIITTEASFNKSLTFLIETFYKAALFDTSDPNALITPLDKSHLFSNIQDIHATSTQLLLDLDQHFQEDPIMKNICDIIFEYSETKLSYYITYVRNQSYQVKMLEKIRSQPKLDEELQRLQRMPACNGLDLNSFLILPMQRIVRLRLLVTAVLKYTPKSSHAYRSGLLALASLEKAIAMENRELVKEGHLNLLLTSNAPRASTRRRLSDAMRCKPAKVHLFLITDMLLITRPKGEKFYVLDVCPLEKIKASPEQLPTDFENMSIRSQRMSTRKDSVEGDADNHHHIHHQRDPLSRSKFERISLRSRRSSSIGPRKVPEQTAGSNLEGNAGQGLQEFPLCITVETPEGTKKSYHLVAESLNSRERWLDLLQPGYKSASEEPGGAQNVYREVIATTSHGSTEGDEIEVKEGDIMTILTDLPDGWYKCALTDGRAGWVPKKICSELDDPVARQLHLNNFALSKEASRVYAEMKGQDHGTVFQRLRVFFGTDL